MGHLEACGSVGGCVPHTGTSGGILLDRVQREEEELGEYPKLFLQKTKTVRSTEWAKGKKKS